MLLANLFTSILSTTTALTSTLTSTLTSSLASTLIASLTQIETNGASLYGTLSAPTFPIFLTNNPLSKGYPWGALTAKGNNPYTSAPVTGVTRYYNFNITRGIIAPDGYQKSVILINGQFPGPIIEANWGDTVQVNVQNSLTGPLEGISVHWHGLLQKSTPWADGVPSVSQCPIAPGSSELYTFQADLYGTSWYHSHYSAQAAGGLLGPMIIHGPSNAAYDIDLGPVFLTDWFHPDYNEVLKSVTGTNLAFRPYSDNNLINGKMNFNCSTVASGDTTTCNSNAGLSKFKFTSGKTHRLRLINAGAEGLQRFSIDGHTMTVIANDFVPVVPYTTNVVTLGVGQRTDVLVTANASLPNSAFWMRSNISELCSYTSQGNALAAIYYDKADTTLTPSSSAWNVPDKGTCANDDLSKTVPYFPITPPSVPATTKTITIAATVNATGHLVWTMNGQTFHADYNNPLLLLASQGNTSYPNHPEWNVQDFGSNSSIRVILQNPTTASHPMHLHGHNMYILAEGQGTWDGTITNAMNPQRRDVQIIRPNGYMVWQIDADNPGVWPFHCHIAWHVSSGLYANILERPADISKLVLPLNVEKTCLSWELWASTVVVNEIDSGL